MLKNKTAAVLEDTPKEYFCNHHHDDGFFLNQNHKNRKKNLKPTKTVKRKEKNDIRYFMKFKNM